MHDYDATAGVEECPLDGCPVPMPHTHGTDDDQHR